MLLAGGASRRMGGVNKALLELGGVRIVERVARAMKRVFPEVILITNTPSVFEFLLIPSFHDIIPGHGSLGGLYTGLRSCAGDYAFLAACDMPFIDERVLRYMTGLITEEDIIAPKIGGHWEPLHAIYSRSCLPFIERLMQEHDLKIINIFKDLKVRAVCEDELKQFDPECRFLMNVNTPEDVRQARTMIAR
ncbi:MAG: molybdenum cofactor guanylyltransferase [Thermodesulfobacteriota bacterium]